MFLGEYTPTLDDKGRLTLPAKFRDQLPEAVLTSETDRCLALWPRQQFDVKAREMQEQAKLDRPSRERAAFFFSGALEVVLDKVGRIAIPQNLRDFAELAGAVVVTGSYDHVEIWSPDAWHARKARGAASMEQHGESP